MKGCNTWENRQIAKSYSFFQVVRHVFTADGIFGWISIYLANQKIPKTRFLPKSIKIIRKNAILTKFPKLRCPKGRSTALFACQKYIFVIFWPFSHFLAKKLSFFGLFGNFWPKIVIFWPKMRFYRIF